MSINHYAYDGFYGDRTKKLYKFIKGFSQIHYFTPSINTQKVDALCIENEYEQKYGGNIWTKFRPIENNEASNSIMLFGCSYTHGMYLQHNESLSYYLGKELPDYTIFNRAIIGGTSSHMLYQTEKYNFPELKDKNRKIFVYIFMPDHFYRDTYSYITIPYPYYKQINKKLVLDKYSLKYISTPIITTIKYKDQDSFNKNELYSKTNPLSQKSIKKVYHTIDIINQSYNNIKNIFGEDSIFIVLRYDRGEIEKYDKYFDAFKNTNIKVLSIQDLTNTDMTTKEYVLADGVHPNSVALEKIGKALAQYLKEKIIKE